MKTKVSVIVVSFAFVTAALLGFLMPEAKATMYHGGTISPPGETWFAADNPHIIDSDVTVALGATLIIQAGADVRFNASTNIFVNGDLLAIGRSSYITFTSNLGQKSAGDWGTIQINSQFPIFPGSEISYSIIEYATTGITDARGIKISHDYITDNIRGIYVNNANPSIEYSTIVNSTNNGIDWDLTSPVSANGKIYNCNISDNGGKGVYLVENAALPIGYNTINSNHDGIYSVKSGPDIYHNTISGNTVFGIYAEDYTHHNVQIRDNNEITSNVIGIYALRADMLIWDNTVSSNTQGIFLDYSPSKTENNTITSNTNFGIWAEKSNQTIYNNDLTNNGLKAIRYQFWKITAPPGLDNTAFFQTVQDIQNNTVTSDVSADGIYIENANTTIINNSISWFDSGFNMGIYLNYANGTITNNSVENNSYGIFCQNQADPEVHGNNIANNDDYGMYNDDSTINISATYNWWNHASGPYHDGWNPGGQGDTVSDDINFVPWLTVPAF